MICSDLSILDKVTVIDNTEKKWEMANVLAGINHSLVKDNDVILRCDPDDFLCDLDALRILNDVYNQTNCDVLWTKHRWFDDNQVTNFNISEDMPNNADPYKYKWVTSHCKTFRKHLINNIPDENFRGSDGKYITRAGDQSLLLPILSVAKKRMFLPLVTYAYRCNLQPETFQTEDAKFQLQESQYIRARGFISIGKSWESMINDF